MDFTPSRLEEKTLSNASEAAPYLTDAEPSVSWVDVQGLGDAQILQDLKKVFGIHDLAMADVVNIPQRPKVEFYDRYLFIVTRMAYPLHDGTLHSEQVSLFLGKDFVLTFQETYGDCLDPVRERIRSGTGLLRKSGADYLAYAIIDAILDQYFPVIEILGEEIERLEDEVVSQPRPETMRKIYELKRAILEVRRAIWPQRDAVNVLLHDESGLIGKEAHFYLRDCYDHTVQIMEVIESLRELAAGLLDVYLSAIANRTNEVMKILTVVTTIFIPLTFIVGIYGMNFDTSQKWNMPELRAPYGYATLVGIMLLIGISLLVFFWRKGWLQSAAVLQERRRPRKKRSESKKREQLAGPSHLPSTTAARSGEQTSRPNRSAAASDEADATA